MWGSILFVAAVERVTVDVWFKLQDLYKDANF